MGDEEDRLAAHLPYPQQFGLHDHARLGVERGKRLVHQQHFGINREGTRQVHALTHSA
jgi:hypothetical protein